MRKRESRLRRRRGEIKKMKARGWGKVEDEKERKRGKDEKRWKGEG